jgi:pimeloyl-ACP methyl ester carboxylesterase
MNNPSRPHLAWRHIPAAAALSVAFAAAGSALADAKDCAIVLLHDRGGSAAPAATLGRKLQSVCAAKSLEMPWSARRAETDPRAAWPELARHIKELRQQGATRVLVGGWGYGANAALAFAGASSDADGVVLLAPEAEAAALGPLPAAASGLRQHAPALWVIGETDPLHQRGEAFAFGKAPPHPLSRYVSVKADRKGTPDAAVKPMLEWIKSLD